jgi:hypothetical protein
MATHIRFALAERAASLQATLGLRDFFKIVVKVRLAKP